MQGAMLAFLNISAQYHIEMQCDIPHSLLHILQECPRHNEEYQTFHLIGALRDILGDGSP
jgi:hypothetical protein